MCYVEVLNFLFFKLHLQKKPPKIELNIMIMGPLKKKNINSCWFGSSQVAVKELKSQREMPAWQVTHGSMVRCPEYVPLSWCLPEGPGATASL